MSKGTNSIITGAVIILLAFLYQEFDLSFLDKNAVFRIGGQKEGQINFSETNETYKVKKVVDGDTLTIAINGVDEKVRLIGINTPETVDPRTEVQCFGKEATARMRFLAEGRNVQLEVDDSQGQRDTYNRLLAYVYLEDGQMLNRKMVAEGYAYEYTYLTPYKYQKEFKELQNLARTSERGLWANETCGGKK